MAPFDSISSTPRLYYAITTDGGTISSVSPKEIKDAVENLTSNMITNKVTTKNKNKYDTPFDSGRKSAYQEGWNDASDLAIAITTPKKIIYNPPATIVFWQDGEKTVVKCMKGEKYSKYFGFLAALGKRMYGNNNQVMKIVESGIEEKKTEKKATPVKQKNKKVDKKK